MNMRSFNFALSFMATKLIGIWYVFQKKYWSDHNQTWQIPFKFHEDIVPFRVKVRSLIFLCFLPHLSMHVFSKASWPRFWPPENKSCHVTNSCYRIGQRGCFDWWARSVYCNKFFCCLSDRMCCGHICEQSRFLRAGWTFCHRDTFVWLPETVVL